MTSVLGDFNAKSKSLDKKDTAFPEGSIIDAVTSNYSLHQLTIICLTLQLHGFDSNPVLKM